MLILVPPSIPAGPLPALRAGCENRATVGPCSGPTATASAARIPRDRMRRAAIPVCVGATPLTQHNRVLMCMLGGPLSFILLSLAMLSSTLLRELLGSTLGLLAPLVLFLDLNLDFLGLLGLPLSVLLLGLLHPLLSTLRGLLRCASLLVGLFLLGSFGLLLQGTLSRLAGTVLGLRFSVLVLLRSLLSLLLGLCTKCSLSSLGIFRMGLTLSGVVNLPLRLRFRLTEAALLRTGTVHPRPRPLAIAPRLVPLAPATLVSLPADDLCVPSFPLGGVEVLTLPSACLATLANGPRTAVIRAISEVLVIGTTAAVLMVERGRECPLTPSLVVPQGVPSLSSESLHAEPLLMVVVRTATITLMLALPLLAVPLVPVGTRLVVRASGRELLPVVLIAVERSRRVLVRADRLTTHVACVGALAGHPHLAGPAHFPGLVVFAPGHAGLTLDHADPNSVRLRFLWFPRRQGSNLVHICTLASTPVLTTVTTDPPAVVDITPAWVGSTLAVTVTKAPHLQAALQAVSTNFLFALGVGFGALPRALLQRLQRGAIPGLPEFIKALACACELAAASDPAVLGARVLLVLALETQAIVEGVSTAARKCHLLPQNRPEFILTPARIISPVAACLRAVPPCPRVVTLLRLLVPRAARRVCLILVLPPRVMSFPFVFASGLLLRVLLSRMLLLCRRLLRRLPPGLARFDLEDLLNLDFAEFVLRVLRDLLRSSLRHVLWREVGHPLPLLPRGEKPVDAA